MFSALGEPSIEFSAIKTLLCRALPLARSLQWLLLYPLSLAAQAVLPAWDFESGLQEWTGVNAVVLLADGTRDGGEGSKVAQVTMSANGTYDGARVDISGAIAQFQSHFAAADYVEISAWVKVSDASDRNTLINLAFKAKQNTADKFTYLDQLRSGPGNGISREDGWVRMRAVIPSFRMAWDEYTNDTQSGALYAPTSLALIARAASAGDSFLLDDVRFTPMIPGIYSDYTPPLSSSPDDFLRPGHGSEGFRLIDANGTDVVLNGINMWLYSDSLSDPVSLLWNYYLYSFREGDLARIRDDYGMNVVRLNLDYRWFEKDYDTTTKASVFKKEGWAWMDRMIGQARDKRIYLIVDLHTPPGGFQGPGGATAPYFSNTDLRQRTENFWVAFAQRYRHEPIIAAYDLVNEPRPQTNADWYAEAERLTAAIRQAGGDSNHMVLVESPFPTDGRGFTILRIADSANRVLYDLHYYSPPGFTFNSDTTSTYVSDNTNLSDGIFGEISLVQSDDWEDAIVESIVPTVYDMTQSDALSLYPGQLSTHARSPAISQLTGTHAAPINIGEFGLKVATFQRAQSAAADYLSDLHQVMDRYAISRQQWSFRGDMGLYPAFAGFLPVDSQRNEALHQLLIDLKAARTTMLKPEDTDDDGLADVWERQNFGTLIASDGTIDSDKDGSSDLAEYLGGSDPSDPCSAFRLRRVADSAGGIQLQWNGIPWRHYTIERARSLAPDDFSAIATRQTAGHSTLAFSENLLLAQPAAFYRIRVSHPSDVK